MNLINTENDSETQSTYKMRCRGGGGVVVEEVNINTLLTLSYAQQIETILVEETIDKRIYM